MKNSVHKFLPMPQIIPAFLTESEQQFDTQLRLIQEDCEFIQVDILDGSLFPHISWHDPVAIGNMTIKPKIELHLMVENPLPIIELWKKHVPNVKRAVVSAEMHRPLGSIIAEIKEKSHLETGVAINPETPLKEIEDVLHIIDQLTIMGVHSGAMGQTFLGEMILDKIKQAKHHRPGLLVEIDGGVTEELIPILMNAGADRIVSGSLIFHDQNPTTKLQRLNTFVR